MTARARTTTEFRLLGPLEVVLDGRRLQLGGPKQRSLLAVLLLRANEVVPVERLVDELWGESPPATVSKIVQVYVSRLRRELGDGRLVTRAPGYMLHVDASELDLACFERLVAEASDADPRAAAPLLREALALWRGPPLADLAYESFAHAPVARLEELRLHALEERIDAELATGRHGELVPELEELVATHPLRERLRAQLMLALYRCGRQADALDAYHDARGALTEGLGIEPGRGLRELQTAILSQDAALELAAAAPASSTFVGRAPELAQLAAGLDDAFAGHGRLFLVSGEPGIGKSRLADELIAAARARGAGVLVGRCWEAGGAPAYWPWVQVLRAHARASDPGTLREQLGSGAAVLAQIAPELRELLPDLADPPALDPDAARFRLFDATAQFLRNAARARPTVVVVDDLHAADAPSLLLLRYLARELGSIRALVLGAYRDVDPVPGETLAASVRELVREPVTQRIALSGLSEREVAEYVEATAPEPAPAELVTALYEEAEGNPLFVGEIVRLLAIEGMRSGAIAIPQSVREVIARRLTHLSGECNRVLVLASVLGREFRVETLAALAGIPEDQLLELLDEAIAARVVSDLPDARVRFAHVLIRDSLYADLTGAQRMRIHRLVVAVLEARHGADPGPVLAQLAHHAMKGRDRGKAVRYATGAADRALEQFAWEEAARLYATALAALEPGDERRRCELLLSRGEAETRAGDTESARSSFLGAAEIARRLGLAPELALAAAGYGGRFMWARPGGDDRLVPLLEEALAALGDGDVELRARLLARLSGALRDEHSRARRDRLSREAVELARRAQNPAALAYALDGRAAAIMAPDTASECLALAIELREVAERIGDVERIVNALDHRRTAQVMLGDVTGVEAALAADSRIARGLRQPFQLWQVHSSQAMVALAAGRLAEAEELIEKALSYGEPVQPGVAVPVHRLQRLALCEFTGRLEEAEAGLRDAVAAYPTRPVFRCALAHAGAALGRSAEAAGAFAALARDDVSVLPFDQEWLLGMAFLAETCALLGETRSAPDLYRLMSPWVHLNVADHPEGIRGSVARYLGILATVMERWNDAERQFEEAVAFNARMGAVPWLAYTRHDYARMLRARDLPGDGDRARELDALAHAGFAEIGIQPPPEPAALHP